MISTTTIYSQLSEINKENLQQKLMIYSQPTLILPHSFLHDDFLKTLETNNNALKKDIETSFKEEVAEACVRN